MATIIGTHSNDNNTVQGVWPFQQFYRQLTGGSDWDTIYGMGGSDIIAGNEGNDKLFGDAPHHPVSWVCTAQETTPFTVAQAMIISRAMMAMTNSTERRMTIAFSGVLAGKRCTGERERTGPMAALTTTI